MDNPAVFSTDRLARHGCMLLGMLLLPLMVMLSFDFGVTWDEKFRQENGRYVADYLTSGSADASSFSDTDFLYGGLFDGLCALIQP